MPNGNTSISPLDLAWLFIESDNTPMHVGCLQIFDVPNDAAPDYASKLYERLITQTHCVAPFSLRMHRNGLAPPNWETVDEVDMEYHVQNWAVTSPGDAQALHELVAHLHETGLDMDKPLWEFHVIEGLPDQQIAVYIKVHHALMDGIGGMRLLQSMLSTSADELTAAPWSSQSAIAHMQILDEPQEKKHRSWTQNLGKLMEQVKNLPEVSGSLRSLAWAGLHKHHSTLQAPYTAPQCQLNQKVSRQRHFAAASLALDEVRNFAHHAGVSINDVLLSVCAGGIREYLLAHSALPKDSLIAGLPVSVRPAGDAHVGTAVSFAVATLATDQDDFRERLHNIHASTQAAKKHLSSLNKTALTEYTLLMMAPFMTELATGLAGRATPAFNVIISNVPGPKQDLFFNGARLKAMYPLSIVTHGQALNITMISYADQIQIGLTCCKQRIPEVETMARAIEQEMQRLTEWRHAGDAP